MIGHLTCLHSSRSDDVSQWCHTLLHLTDVAAWIPVNQTMVSVVESVSSHQHSSSCIMNSYWPGGVTCEHWAVIGQLDVKWLVNTKFIPGTWWTVNFRSPRSNTWPSSILVTVAAETELSGSSTILLQHLATLSSSLLTSLQVWESPPQHWSSWLSCTCLPT